MKKNILKAFAISLPMAFSQAASAQSPVIVDTLNNARRVDHYLADNCRSYRDSDVENCVNTQMELTLGLANAFQEYLDRHVPFHRAARPLAENCQNNFNAIVALTPPDVISSNPQRYLPLFVRHGFLGSRQCLETIESIGRSYGIDYMPTSRELLHDMIDNAEQGRLVFRFSA